MGIMSQRFDTNATSPADLTNDVFTPKRRQWNQSKPLYRRLTNGIQDFENFGVGFIRNCRLPGQVVRFDTVACCDAGFAHQTAEGGGAGELGDLLGLALDDQRA